MTVHDDYENVVKGYDILYFKETPKGVVLEKNLFAVMRDGVKLALDVYKPAQGGGPWPVILAMAPYKKEQLWETGNVGFYVSQGYVMINAQVRGSGLSQGAYNFFDHVEQQDGYDLVEWTAAQTWCDGNVGMLGASYLAMSQWYTAIQNPPHLKCIVPYSGGTDIYRNSHYIGGVYHKFFMNMWGPGQTKQCLWPGPVPGKFQPPNFMTDWYSLVEDGPYYQERSPYLNLHKIKIPVLSILNAHNFIHSTSQLRSWSDFAAVKKLMVVPETPGLYQTFFDINLGLNRQILRWLDHWLRGIDTGIMNEPPVAIFDNGTGKWRYENEYPIARTKWTKFHLGSNSAGSAAAPPWGVLGPAPQSTPAEPEVLDVPSTPLMERLPMKPIPFLAYASEPLAAPLTIQGPISITLYGSAETVNTSTWAWYVKLGEISPDGKTRLWTYGNLKASFRKIDPENSRTGQPWRTYQRPENAEPGKTYEFEIEIMPLFLTFKAGHRIWVQVACEDPNYENGNAYDPVGLRDSVAARVRLYHDPEHPSHLLLPVIPEAPEIAPVEAPLSEAHWGGSVIS